MGIFGNVSKDDLSQKQISKKIGDELHSLFGYGEEEEARVKGVVDELKKINDLIKDSEKAVGKNLTTYKKEMITDLIICLKADIRNKKFTYLMDKIEEKIEQDSKFGKYSDDFLKRVKKLKTYLVEIEKLVGQAFPLDKKLLNELKNIGKTYDAKGFKEIQENNDKDLQLHELLLRHNRFMLQEILVIQKSLKDMDAGVKNKNIEITGRYSKGRDLSGLSLNEINSRSFKGAVNKEMPKLLAKGYKPASIADIIRTRVEVYKKLKNQGLTEKEISKHELYRFWWETLIATGDAMIYSNKYTFQTGKNELWDCNERNSDEVMHCSKLASTEISPNFKLTKEEALQNKTWLIFVQGDYKLLNDYVALAFHIYGDGLMKIVIQPELKKESTNIEGRLLFLETPGDWDVYAGVLSYKNPRLFGV